MGKRNWAWFEEEQRHPDGRARGGEPCILCGKPIPAGCYWKWRDRHVCSSRCSTNLRRRLNRRISTGRIVQPPPEHPVVQRNHPATFATNTTAVFPFEFAGNSPLAGDSVERYGSVTTYHECHDEAGRVDPTKLLCAHRQTGSAALVGISPTGDQANSVRWGIYRPEIGWHQWSTGDTFVSREIEWHWYQEIIRALDDVGKPYTWTAVVCSATPTDTLWTPEYLAFSQRLHRISASTASHLRRQRVEHPGAERIDPLEVFESDAWLCRLCGEPIDRDARAPHPRSASLDHIIPLAANGTHTRSNVQAAHLSCNVRKGARIFAAPAGCTPEPGI